MKTKQEAIRAFAAAGFPLIPLSGKKPVEAEWENTPLGRHDETTIKGNYGICLSSTDLVVDVDPRNFKPGDQPLKRLIVAIGGVPPGVLVVGTGGGGLHIYLKKPADLSVRNSHPDYPGIEFKGGPGRQVVGPFSIHPESGKAYTIAQGSPSVAAEAPQSLLDLIRRPLIKEFAANGTGAYQDDEATRARYTTLLMFAPTTGTYKIACQARDAGLSPQVALELIGAIWNPRRATPRTEDELREKILHAYTYAKGAVGNAHPAAHFEPVGKVKETPAGVEPDDEQVGKSGWRLDGKKQPVKCFQNLLNYFSLSQVKLRGCFGYNEFGRAVEIVAPPPWQAEVGLPVTDMDLQRLRAHLARNHGYEASKDDLVDAMVDVSQRRRFHPVKKYLDTLTWDGKPRLDSWLVKYLGVEDDGTGYVQAVARKTLVAAVARIYEPGCKFDHVLVLEGKQGLGKSGVCKVLGGEWFSDFKMNVGEKDTVQMMQGKWIVEMPDLHATRQADIDLVKSFLTRQVDEARFAYGRLPGRYPRQGIFIATYNPGPDGTYLKDEENRRWWPVMTHPVVGGVFDFAGLKAVRDQLWAEAAVLYKKKEALTMDTTELKVAARAAQNARRADHPWAERVGEWVAERDLIADTRAEFYTAREIFVGAMGGLDARYGRREQLDASKALRELGWEPGFKRRGGELVRGFWRKESVTSTMTAPKRKAEMSIFGDLA